MDELSYWNLLMGALIAPIFPVDPGVGGVRVLEVVGHNFYTVPRRITLAISITFDFNSRDTVMRRVWQYKACPSWERCGFGKAEAHWVLVRVSGERKKRSGNG
jgi:hypothetical protein